MLAPYKVKLNPIFFFDNDIKEHVYVCGIYNTLKMSCRLFIVRVILLDLEQINSLNPANFVLFFQVQFFIHQIC